MSDTPQRNDSAQQSLEPLQVDVVEAGRLLRYSRATIYEMLNSGELPSTRHGASSMSRKRAPPHCTLRRTGRMHGTCSSGWRLISTPPWSWAMPAPYDVCWITCS